MISVPSWLVIGSPAAFFLHKGISLERIPLEAAKAFPINKHDHNGHSRSRHELDPTSHLNLSLHLLPFFTSVSPAEWVTVQRRTRSKKKKLSSHIFHKDYEETHTHTHIPIRNDSFNHAVRLAEFCFVFILT